MAGPAVQAFGAEQHPKGDVRSFGGVRTECPVSCRKARMLGPVTRQWKQGIICERHGSVQSGGSTFPHEQKIGTKNHNSAARIHAPEKVGKKELIKVIAAAQQDVACVEIAESRHDLQ